MPDSLPEQLLEMRLHVDGDTWVPTPHGEFMAQVLAGQNLVEGRRVLEIGGGAANHTIILLRQGAKHVVVTEITADLLAANRRNVEHNCPGDRDRIEYRVADWLDTPGSFDLIVTNPPFCKSGKQNRRYFIDSLILDGHKRLASGGSLLFIQSSMADLAKTRARLDENGYEVEILASRRGPFRDYYFEDAAFMKEIEDVPGAYEKDGSTFIETLSVVSARLRDRGEAAQP